MRNKILVAFLVAGAALASVRITRGSGLEAGREAAASPFEQAQAAIPVAVNGANSPLRCDARVQFSTPGFGGRCHFNKVVTEVRLVNNQLEVSCGELQVTCR